MLRVAALQMVSGLDVEQNLREAAVLLAQAAQQQAQLCVLPENFALMGKQDAALLDIQESLGEGRLQDFLSTQARQHGLWLVGGTLPLQAETPDHVRSACLVFNPDGQLAARYDKIHLFDVHLSNGEAYCESSTFEAGQQPVLVETPWGKLGLAICYDLRFPELFRHLMQQGARFFALPSAFTAATGAAHWDILVRARACENLSFVIAANQGGTHQNGRSTYGDSLICDPWGQVLQRLPQGAGIVCSDLNLDEQHSIRQRFPCLQHQKLFA